MRTDKRGSAQAVTVGHRRLPFLLSGARRTRGGGQEGRLGLRHLPIEPPAEGAEQ
jgi:hypothetical protein